MKKLLIIAILVLSAQPLFSGETNDIQLPEYVESPVKMAIQLLRPTNAQQINRELNVYGSIVATDYSFYNAVAILLRIDDNEEIIKIPLSSPGFRTNLSFNDYAYGEHTLNVYAVGDFSEYEDSADKLIFASNNVTFERTLSMSVGGWIFMILAWTAIISLLVFSFLKTFSIREEKIVEPLEIDTGDDSY